MPYSKSRSRKAFELNLKRLKELSKTASYKKSNFSYDHQNLVCQSAIFLACASIEEYLKNFFEDFVFELGGNSAVLADIPENLRALKLLKSQSSIFKTFILNGDESKSINAINKAWSNYEVTEDAKLLTNQIKSSDIVGTKKYPSPKNLKVLYNRMGIKDVLNQIAAKGKKDYKSQLESFLSVREAISHQAAPTVTHSDVKRHFKNILDIVNQLDRVKYSQITKVSSGLYWPC
jgi:hypothetical protein